MHYMAYVLIRKDEDAAGGVSLRMARHVEDIASGRRRRSVKCDGYMVGGRWTGALNGYRPSEDARNYVRCFCCGGTGTRPGSENFSLRDERRSGRARSTPFPQVGEGCNGCFGTGKMLRSPTEWRPGGVLAPVAALLGPPPPGWNGPAGELRTVVATPRPWPRLPDALVRPAGGWRTAPWGLCGVADQAHAGWRRLVLRLLEKHRDCTLVVVDCHT